MSGSLLGQHHSADVHYQVCNPEEKVHNPKSRGQYLSSTQEFFLAFLTLGGVSKELHGPLALRKGGVGVPHTLLNCLLFKDQLTFPQETHLLNRSSFWSMLISTEPGWGNSQGSAPCFGNLGPTWMTYVTHVTIIMLAGPGVACSLPFHLPGLFPTSWRTVGVALAVGRG